MPSEGKSVMNRLPEIKIKDGRKFFLRFTLHQRIQHAILAISVIILVLTGMPLKFHDAFWAPYLYNLFGGIRIAPVVHKAAGSVLTLLFLYHIIYIITTLYAGYILPLREKKGVGFFGIIMCLINHPLVPCFKDVKDIFATLRYNLFLSDTPPHGAQWTWKDKADYWGPFWGMPILVPTGFIMWHQEVATMVLPGEVINYALIAHSDEALLAFLFLFIWHWYNVHFSLSVFPMGTAFITGYLPEELMVEDHYQHYVEVMKRSGLEKEILPPPGRSAEKKAQPEKETVKGQASGADMAQEMT